MAESKASYRVDGGSDSKSDSKAEGAQTVAEAKVIDTAELVDKVQEFCLGEQLEQDFEAFAEEYAPTFEVAMEFKDGQEHPLSFYDVYREYLRRFEKKIENFITREGYVVEQFYAGCRKVLDDDEVFGTRRFFVETLMATSEYEYFFMLMKAEMQRITHERSKK